MKVPDLLALATRVVANMRDEYASASVNARGATENASSVIEALVDLVRVFPCPTCGMLRGGRNALQCACADVAARSVPFAGFTALEVESLQKAREYVRVHMAHEHSWEVRDAAMTAISKVLDVARTAVPS